MKVYKSNEEVIADIKKDMLFVDGDVVFESDICIKANLVVTGDLKARNIKIVRYYFKSR